MVVCGQGYCVLFNLDKIHNNFTIVERIVDDGTLSEFGGFTVINGDHIIIGSTVKNNYNFTASRMYSIINNTVISRGLLEPESNQTPDELSYHSFSTPTCIYGNVSIVTFEFLNSFFIYEDTFGNGTWQRTHKYTNNTETELGEACSISNDGKYAVISSRSYKLFVLDCRPSCPFGECIFSNPRCTSCYSGHYGPDCAPCNCPPNSYCIDGIDGNGTCLCNAGFTGINCSDCTDITNTSCICPPGYYGSSCTPCNCSPNDCDDGRNGTGTCSQCPRGRYGVMCDLCDCGYQYCSDGVGGTGECTCKTCTNCTFSHEIKGCICDSNTFGSDCTPCSCKENEKCSDGIDGNGSCCPYVSDTVQSCENNIIYIDPITVVNNTTNTTNSIVIPQLNLTGTAIIISNLTVVIINDATFTNTTVNIKNGTLVAGNITLTPSVTLNISTTNNNTPIIVQGCAYLNGSLNLDLSNYSGIQDSLTVINSSCLYGRFSQVNVEAKKNCTIYKYNYTRVSFGLDFLTDPSCQTNDNSEGGFVIPFYGIIGLGVGGGLILLVIVVTIVCLKSTTLSNKFVPFRNRKFFPNAQNYYNASY
eukprot:TRINITY_DN7440_c0_g1_i1.p1 TRINITY_DN7440_c0_g1~~TRINITY_DN7440_c0_g1_i1.p1  ORF type:complete len:587 (-),score=22.89 TRINITY_DN7440_c0_g1_i1:110-1870(-)